MLETEWYKLICQHCDGEGYVSYTHKLPLYSENVNNPNSSAKPIQFEVLQHENKGTVRIRHLCNRCGGLKYHMFNSDDWKLEIIKPKPANEQKG